MLKISSASSLIRNSPFELNSFKAFQFFGLWLAVKIIPPLAFFCWTIIWVVGVVDKSISITLIPIEIKVDLTISFKIDPEILPSLATTIELLLLEFLLFIQVPYALTYFTTSIGVKFDPFLPFTVPLMPEIELINVILVKYTIRILYIYKSYVI